jgi:predicted nucleotidyltransferase
MNPELVKKTDPLEKAIEIIIRSVDPEKIILFGSRARGDHNKESDYDICVIKKGVLYYNKHEFCHLNDIISRIF